MKVLLVNKFHYKKGGSETYYFTLAQALQSQGHQVVYFAMADEKNEPCDQSKFFVSHVDYNSDSQNVFGRIWSGIKLIYSTESKKKMRLLIEREKPDLAILNLVHRQLTLSIVDELRKFRVPIFFVMHDLICICPNYTMLSHGKLCERCSGGHFLNCPRQKCVKGSFPKSLLAAAEAYFYKWRKTYDKVDLYIAPSVFLQHKLQSAGFTHSPIVHMRNPLPADTVYGLPEKAENYFLYFGRLSPEKGVLTLLKAVKELRELGKIALRIAGDGPQRPELEQYVRENELADQVSFLGFQTGQKLRDTVERCRCVILPSECYENCPYSILEAMVKGRPCIVSNLGGLPELVEDGKNGYVFQARDVDSLRGAIEKLLSLNAEEYSGMCTDALNKAKEEFDPNRYLDRLFGEYRRIKPASEDDNE